MCRCNLRLHRKPGAFVIFLGEDVIKMTKKPFYENINVSNTGGMSFYHRFIGYKFALRHVPIGHRCCPELQRSVNLYMTLVFDWVTNGLVV